MRINIFELLNISSKFHDALSLRFQAIDMIGTLGINSNVVCNMNIGLWETGLDTWILRCFKII